MKMSADDLFKEFEADYYKPIASSTPSMNLEQLAKNMENKMDEMMKKFDTPKETAPAENIKKEMSEKNVDGSQENNTTPEPDPEPEKSGEEGKE